jgi:hypothetical protein
LVSLNGRDYSEDLGVDERIIQYLNLSQGNGVGEHGMG